MWRLKVAAASVAAFISFVYYMYAKGNPSEHLLADRCRYDIKVLCPDCFPNHASCTDLYKIYYKGGALTKAARDEFEQHSIRYDITYDDNPNIVVINLNRNKVIENVRDEICAKHGLTMQRGSLRNSQIILKELRKKVGDDNREEGAVMCPRNDDRAIERFVRKFDQPELLTLLLMKVNSQSLIVWLGSRHNLPVPSFVHQGGSILVESFEGKPLTSFYQRPTQQKLKLAYEIIKAMVKLNAGVDDFRIYLTNMNGILDPDDIMVNVLPNATLQITFVALDKVVIFNDVNKTITGIKCTNSTGVCYCPFRHGDDVNLVQLCRMFVENKRKESKKGFLSFLYDNATYEEYKPIRERLHHCLNCKDPNCERPSELFRQIQEAINKTFISR